MKAAALVLVTVSCCLSMTLACPAVAHAHSDAFVCQSVINKAGRKFKAADLKAWRSCLESQLKGGTCDEAKRDAVVDSARIAAQEAIAAACTSATLFHATGSGGIGFPQTCRLLGANQ